MLSRVTADTITSAQIHVVRKAMLGVPRKNSYHQAILSACGGALDGDRPCRASVARAYNKMQDPHRLTPEECTQDADRSQLNQAKAAAYEAYLAANRVLGLLDETADPAWIKHAEATRESAWALYSALQLETEW